MATEASFTVPTTEFPLGSIFTDFPEVTVELERVIPSQDSVIPYFWVRGQSIDHIQDAFDNHPAVANVDCVDSVDDEYLLRADWNLAYDGVLNTLAETHVTLIKAVGTHNQWTFDVRGDSRQNLTEFQQRCQEYEIPIQVTKVHALTPIESITEAVLTEPQQEALVLAYERGYFESPRETTMSELGDELGITQQAVASRLRRGISRILDQTLTETEP